MSWFEIIADRKIREAQDKGAFDGLPGRGRPLQLDSDPRVPPELRAAYRLMKEAHLLPDWIQLDKELRERQARWAEAVERFAVEWEAARADAVSAGAAAARARLDRRRDDFLLRAAGELREQNRMIDRLNLIVPTPAQQRPRLRLPERLAELETRFPRLEPLPPGVEAPWAPLLHESRPATRLGNRMPLRRKKDSIG